MPAFWVNPVAPSDPSYEGIVNAAIELINSTRLSNPVHIADLTLLELQDATGRYVVIIKRAGAQLSVPASSDSPLALHQPHFLQRVLLTTKYGLVPDSPIPPWIIGPSSYEADLAPFLPNPLIFKTGGEADPTHVHFCRALLEVEREREFVEELATEIVDVACSVPSTEHDWLVEQLMGAILAQRLENFYLDLYRIFEFFFPLTSIFSLKSRLGFSDTELTLLSHCRESLNWNINHHTGVRGASAYGSLAFAETILGSFQPDNEDPAQIDEQRQRYKTKACEVLAEARHTLTHQDFCRKSLDATQLTTLCRAMLQFLSSAFQEYSRRLTANRAANLVIAAAEASAKSEVPADQRNPVVIRARTSGLTIRGGRRVRFAGRARRAKRIQPR